MPYVKGAWILHTLRNQLEDDSLFFDIMHTFSTQNAPKIVESDSFVALVNEKTGEDYNWFFKHYLYNNEAPSLSYNIDENGLLRYKWNNVEGDFKKLTIVINVRGSEYRITPTKEVQTLRLFQGLDAKSISFDNTALFEIVIDKKLK